MILPHGDALVRYNAMREAALADAQNRLIARIEVAHGIPVRLSLIDEVALQAWQAQWRRQFGLDGGWNWREQRLRLGSTVSRFEVALWSGPVLGGLAIGKPSKGPSHLALQLLEGNPAAQHPLKGYVAECAVEAAISYARLLEKKALRLIKPLPGALPIYRRLGFRVEPDSLAPTYCFMEL